MITTGSPILDNYRPRGETVQGPRSATWMDGDYTILGGSNPYAQRAAIETYQGWNYIGIDRLSEFISSQFPCLATKGPRRRKSEARRLDQGAYDPAEIQHWLSCYGTYQVALSELDQVAEHPLLDLLTTPNEEDSWDDMLAEAYVQFRLTGEVYFWVRPSGMLLPSGRWFPRDMTVVPTPWVNPIHDSEMRLIAYRIDVPSGASHTVEIDDLVRVWKKDPRSKELALSPQVACGDFNEASLSVNSTRHARYGNQGRPSVFMSPTGGKDGSGPPLDLDDDQVADLGRRMRKRFEIAQKYGQPFILPPGLEVFPWAEKTDEMQLVEADDQLRNALFAKEGMSQIIAGLTKDSNRSDTEAAMASTCTFTINPTLARFARSLMRGLAHRWDDQLVMYFEDCSPRDWQRELQELKLDAEIGAVTTNERRSERGREEFDAPEANVPLRPAGRVHLFLTDEMMPEEPEDDPDDGETTSNNTEGDDGKATKDEDDDSEE